MAIKDYSTTPDLNTQISGINIAEGCAPSGINNAIRQLMADVKAEKDSRDTQTTDQATKDAAQDAAITAAQSAANSRISNATIDGLDLVLTYGDGSTKRVQLPAEEIVADVSAGQTLLDGKVGALESGSGFNAAGKAEIVGWGMPDYSAGVAVPATNGKVYTAPTDGYFIISCNAANAYVYCYLQILDSTNKVVVGTFGNAIRYSSGQDSLASSSVPIPKGYKVKIVEVQGATLCKFFPLKGA